MSQNLIDQHAQQAVHKADSIGMTAGAGLVTLTAITLNEWVAIVTIVYFVIQILISLPKLISSMVTLWNKYVSKK